MPAIIGLYTAFIPASPAAVEAVNEALRRAIARRG